MTAKITNPSGKVPTQAPTNMEWAHRSLVSANQQKLFESVLQQAQPASQNSQSQAINSLDKELRSLQPSAPASQNLDIERTPNANRYANAANSNPLATSTLLKMAALSGKGEALSSSFNSLGMGAMPRGKIQDRIAMSKPSVQQPAPSDSQELGSLSSRFESGDAGLEAIGYDDTGGTSYGMYQIASRPGTMRRFINFLEDHSPQWARRLRASGPENTGSRRGAMPREWQKIASEDPDRFAKLQHDFIEESHYDPAREEIRERTGIDINKHSKALQEVLWSTAVQHGPKGAANIFCKAIGGGRSENAGLSNTARSEDAVKGQDLIQSVYASRSKQFGSSSTRVRGAVQRRFAEEKDMAMAMLAKEGRGIAVRA